MSKRPFIGLSKRSQQGCGTSGIVIIIVTIILSIISPPVGVGFGVIAFILWAIITK